MVQAILIGMLLTEFAIYVGLGQMFLAQGMSIAAIVSILLLLALCWRLSHALGSFLVTSLLRLRDRRTLPMGNSMAALANELAARFVCFNWSQPFQGLAMGREPADSAQGVPILLVHGYVCNRGLWATFARALAAAGLGPVHTVTLEPVFGGIDVVVPKLEARIEAICEASGASQIMLVAHSMGGLVARDYLAQSDANRVSRLVTLGSPHHGTQLAHLGLGINANHMRENSPWLQALAGREAVNAGSGRPQPKTLSIYTLNDDLVYPAESSVLAWAENVPVSAVGHIGLAFSGPVVRRVIAYLR